MYDDVLMISNVCGTLEGQVEEEGRKQEPDQERLANKGCLKRVGSEENNDSPFQDYFTHC